MKRREMLRLGCRSVATLGLAGGFGRFGAINCLAQGASGYKALVCVFLYGGNDANNMVVPMESREYQQYATLRGQIALPASSLRPITTTSGAAYGLHPSLDELQNLFARRKAAIVANVGTLVRPVTRAQYLDRTTPVPGNLYSHPDQQMQWHTASPSTPGLSGWAGRTADIMRSYNAPSVFPTAVSVAGSTMLLNGQNTEPASVIPREVLGMEGSDGTASANARDAAVQQLLNFDTGFSLVQAASKIAKTGIQHSNLLNNAVKGARPLSTRFPDTPIGRQMGQVATLLRVRSELGMSRQIFFCALSGWDTHSVQLLTQERLYSELSPALGAFYNATEEMGIASDVTTFTESEFGRTLQPSSGNGTDHAWGNHQIVMGGAVKGGALYGRYPTLELGGSDDAGSRGTWIPTISLDQYGATLASWFGLPASQLARVFPNLPNFSTTDLGFLS